MRNHGFSLIELLVIIGIVSSLSLITYGSIVHFKYQAEVDAAANEFISTVKSAQSMSRDGQLPEGNTHTDYSETGLPTYGVVLTASSYTLERNGTLSDLSSDHEVLETHDIDPAISFSPTTLTVTFARMTGFPDNPQSIQIARGGITTSRVITISGDGLIAYDQ